MRNYYRDYEGEQMQRKIPGAMALLSALMAAIGINQPSLLAKDSDVHFAPGGVWRHRLGKSRRPGLAMDRMKAKRRWKNKQARKARRVTRMMRAS